MDECLIYEPDATMLRTALYTVFLEYQRTHGYWKTIDRKKFYHEIREKEPERIQDTTQRDAENIPRHIFRGIKLADGVVSAVSPVSGNLPLLLSGRNPTTTNNNGSSDTADTPPIPTSQK